ncbi:uncharacterized protein N7515_006166 [Penicillium bovifimosum]|uniref:CFEM domain-containing protein n=1 Tax=Penicillium bovifimosum TaxID=126998 RepID=A0A9W9L0W8_9EURO|nr:uncharacterized protein N7515_006166 [Penicillium bovifimosum]KAJ5130127.1 hypothetical protein N7515_006166 [Penicillium bovifimosum]
MKFIVITVLAALLTTAAAQGLGDLPGCSKFCATGAIPKDCGLDIKCICEAKSFLTEVTCCVAHECSKEDQETTIKAAKSICARGGVTDLPEEVVCPNSNSSTGSGSSSTETTTKTGTVTAATKTDGSTTVTGTHTGTTTSTGTLLVSTSTVGATSTAMAAMPHKDSLVAAAGAAAAFAMLI